MAQETPYNEIDAETINAQNIKAQTETINALTSNIPSAQFLGTSATGEVQAGTLTPSFTTVTASEAITAANGTTGTEVVNYSQFANTGNFSSQLFPNGFKIESGVTTTAATSGTVTFPVAYVSAPNVVIGAIGSAASEVAVNTVTTTTFTYTASVAANISYIAIGI